MSLHIAGMGWVTPLGSGVDAIWQRLLRGDEASPSEITGPFENNSYSVFRVPVEALTNLPAHPRLRRADAISRFAVAAGLAALDDARSTTDKIDTERTALIFAVSNGGVSYTKRFYHDVVKTGAGSASPLLFPETVFNAPASHLAAVLGLTGASYTIVGDGSIGILALQMAEDLMTSDAIDHCLVVGAEEADWVLCDAYHKWRLTRAQPPIEPFRKPSRGTILSEGAGAVLLAREGPITIDKIHPGGNFVGRDDACRWTTKILAELAPDMAGAIVSSANGTFIDDAEREAVSERAPHARVYTPKPALGESVGASGIWQVMIGALAARTGRLPAVLHAGKETELRLSGPEAKIDNANVIVLDCGLNQQIAGLRLSAKN
jgi:3-oxoacyl-(acyl-carrier-protein) synthase